MIMNDMYIEPEKLDYEKIDEKLSNAKCDVHIPTLDELVDPEEEKRNKRTRIIATVVGVVTGTIAAVLVNSRKQK